MTCEECGSEDVIEQVGLCGPCEYGPFGRAWEEEQEERYGR